jgi:hypothetical protein
MIKLKFLFKTKILSKFYKFSGSAIDNNNTYPLYGRSIYDFSDPLSLCLDGDLDILVVR